MFRFCLWGSNSTENTLCLWKCSKTLNWYWYGIHPVGESSEAQSQSQGLTALKESNSTCFEVINRHLPHQIHLGRLLETGKPELWVRWRYFILHSSTSSSFASRENHNKTRPLHPSITKEMVLLKWKKTPAPLPCTIYYQHCFQPFLHIPLHTHKKVNNHFQRFMGKKIMWNA